MNIQPFNFNGNTLSVIINETTDQLYIYVGKAGETINNGIILENVMLFVGNNDSASWAPSKTDLQTLVNTKRDYYESITTLPENYRPATKPSKTYKADYLLIKKFPEYKEEVLITQGGIDPSVSSVEAEMIIKTNDGLLQNPEKYFSVGWLKQTNGTFKYKGFKVNISMADIVALNDENKELDYELREDLTLV